MNNFWFLIDGSKFSAEAPCIVVEYDYGYSAQ